ncbi:MAG: type VI secretion system-associated protein TagO [Pseudomonadota bacterium]
MRFAIVMALLLGGANSAIASDSLATCSLIASESDRLACYDRAAGRGAESVKDTEAEGTKWAIYTWKSDLTDDSNVSLFVSANKGTVCKYGDPERIDLVLRCREKTTSAYFSTQRCYFNTDAKGDHGRIDVRFDNDAVTSISTIASSNHKALFLYGDREAIPFIEKLLSTKNLVARFYPNFGSSVTTTFDVYGLDEAIKPLRQACGW